MMAVSAARAIPEGVRWLSASTRVGATRTGEIFAGALLDHYRQTLGEIRQVGYVAYAGRQLGPYVRAAVDQFSPGAAHAHQRLVEKLQSSRSELPSGSQTVEQHDLPAAAGRRRRWLPGRRGCWVNVERGSMHLL